MNKFIKINLTQAELRKMNKKQYRGASSYARTVERLSFKEIDLSVFERAAQKLSEFGTDTDEARHA